MTTSTLDIGDVLSVLGARGIEKQLRGLSDLGLGAPGAAPFFGLPLSPIIAAAAMALSSVSVIANALRLRTMRLGYRNREDAT